MGSVPMNVPANSLVQGEVTGSLARGDGSPRGGVVIAGPGSVGPVIGLAAPATLGVCRTLGTRFQLRAVGVEVGRRGCQCKAAN